MRRSPSSSDIWLKPKREGRTTGWRIQRRHGGGGLGDDGLRRRASRVGIACVRNSPVFATRAWEVEEDDDWERTRNKDGRRMRWRRRNDDTRKEEEMEEEGGTTMEGG